MFWHSTAPASLTNSLHPVTPLLPLLLPLSFPGLSCLPPSFPSPNPPPPRGIRAIKPTLRHPRALQQIQFPRYGISEPPGLHWKPPPLLPTPPFLAFLLPSTQQAQWPGKWPHPHPAAPGQCPGKATLAMQLPAPWPWDPQEDALGARRCTGCCMWDLPPTSPHLWSLALGLLEVRCAQQREAAGLGAS